LTLPDISRYLFHCAITHTRAYTLSQWCSRPSRSHQPFGFDSVFGRPCFRPSRLPQPFGFGSVFGRPYPRIRTPKPLYYASWTLPPPIHPPAHTPHTHLCLFSLLSHSHTNAYYSLSSLVFYPKFILPAVLPNSL